MSRLLAEVGQVKRSSRSVIGHHAARMNCRRYDSVIGFKWWLEKAVAPNKEAISMTTTATEMTIHRLSLDLGVPYAHVWQCARTLGLIEYRERGRNLIVTVDDDDMSQFQRALEIRNRYGINFPQALQMVQDGWSAPVELQDA